MVQIKFWFQFQFLFKIFKMIYSFFFYISELYAVIFKRQLNMVHICMTEVTITYLHLNLFHFFFLGGGGIIRKGPRYKYGHALRSFQ